MDALPVRVAQVAIELSEDTFDATVLNPWVTALVYFHAPW